MKYLLLLITLTTLNCMGQDYATHIASHRKQYMADFLQDKNSPLKQDDLPYLRFYAADSIYRVQASVQLLPTATTFDMPTFTGAGSTYVKYALLSLTLKGQPIQLTVYRSIRLSAIAQYADYLFLPFTDETNGKETYGGGRYIDLSQKDFKENTVMIDFNKAYNPYCAFGGRYQCPKPPDENHLQVAVPAGEKFFAKEIAH